MTNPDKGSPAKRATFAIATALVVVGLVTLAVWSLRERPDASIASQEEEGLVAAPGLSTTPITSSPTIGPEASVPPETTTSTTTTTTTTTSTTTTTIPPRQVTVSLGGESRALVFSPFGWIIPEVALGGRPLGATLDELLPFVAPNDGTYGVTIDERFIAENSGEPWLSEEDGVPTISRIDATGLCLNIATRITLRDSYVSCPTRVQSDAWGFAGQVDDAPAINITTSDAAGTLIEHNTVVCTGFDADICGRSVRVGALGTVIRFNDLSGARGAVSLFDETVFAFNHLHDLSFGFDPTRADSPDDRVTHNNAVNNLGYRDVVVVGNFIDATYGRVSLEPDVNLFPHFPDVYAGGEVAVGDPINGFAFTNYLINGNGDGAVYSRNFVRGAGRPFLCNRSSDHGDSVCAQDLSFNVFEDLQIAGFESTTPFRDSDGDGVLDGGCNFQLIAGDVSLLAIPSEQAAGCEDRLELASPEHAEFGTVLGATDLQFQ